MSKAQAYEREIAQLKAQLAHKNEQLQLVHAAVQVREHTDRASRC
jgi:hypothetical protein